MDYHLGQFSGGVRGPNATQSNPHHGKRFEQGNEFRDKRAKVSGFGDTSSAYRHQRCIPHAEYSIQFNSIQVLFV